MNRPQRAALRWDLQRVYALARREPPNFTNLTNKELRALARECGLRRKHR